MARRRTPKPIDLGPEIEAEILFESAPNQKVRAKRIDAKKLRLPTGTRHWFTARTIGGDLDVVLSNGDVLRDLRGNHGVTLAELGLIALDEDTPLRRLVITLIHELLHGSLTAPGDAPHNGRLFGCNAKQAHAREELIVTHLAPRLADCLIRSGLLRLPPIPRRRRKRA